MDQRPRERPPVMPALAAATDRGRKDAAARLAAARDTPPGEMFTAGGQGLRRARLARSSSLTWAGGPGSGKRRKLTREKGTAVWARAGIEGLPHTGLPSRALPERSHHR